MARGLAGQGAACCGLAGDLRGDLGFSCLFEREICLLGDKQWPRQGFCVRGGGSHALRSLC